MCAVTGMGAPLLPLPSHPLRCSHAAAAAVVAVCSCACSQAAPVLHTPGAAVEVSNLGKALFTDCKFTGNTAGQGGAVAIYSGAAQHGSDSTLQKMEASSEATAIFNKWMGDNTEFKMKRGFKIEPIKG